MKAEPAVFPETPIYSRLIAERGDIPARARDEADRLHRLLEPFFSGTGTPGRRQDAGQQGSFFGTASFPPRTSPGLPAGSRPAALDDPASEAGGPWLEDGLRA